MDKNAIIKALRDYVQATSNEVANTVAAPVDLINAGLGRVGLGSEEPVGGSAWMRRQGLTAPVPEGMAQTLGETTGLVLPMVGAMKAKEIATALRNMGENIAKPKGGGMAGGQRGAIDLGAPQGLQAEALKLAQQRAALPLSKGGLGLPANNTAAQRAEAMGFDKDVYHGTNTPDITAIDIDKSSPYVQYMKGFFTAENPQFASNYGDIIMPLMQKKGTTILDKRAARQAGIEVPKMDTVYDKSKGILVTNNPDNIRSRFAAFDPFRKTAAIAAAMGVAAPDLLAKEKQPTPPQNLVKALRNGN